MATFSLGLRRVVHIAGRALRETGQALDRAGATIQGNYAYKEQCSLTGILSCGANHIAKRFFLEGSFFVLRSSSF
jgi:hypothetical protein